jgi:hypothetical protein
MKFAVGMFISFVASICIGQNSFHAIDFPELQGNLIIDEVFHNQVLLQLNDSNYAEKKYDKLSLVDWLLLKDHRGRVPIIFIGSEAESTFYKIGKRQNSNYVNYLILERRKWQGAVSWSYHIFVFEIGHEFYYLNNVLGQFCEYQWHSNFLNETGILFENGDFVAFSGDYGCYNISYLFNGSINEWEHERITLETILSSENKSNYNYNFLKQWNRVEFDLKSIDFIFFNRNKCFLPLYAFFNSSELLPLISDSLRSDNMNNDRVFILDCTFHEQDVISLLILVERFLICQTATNSTVFRLEIRQNKIESIEEIGYFRPKYPLNQNINEYFRRE